jgi:hypothetical protein
MKTAQVRRFGQLDLRPAERIGHAPDAGETAPGGLLGLLAGARRTGLECAHAEDFLPAERPADGGWRLPEAVWRCIG